MQNTPSQLPGINKSRQPTADSKNVFALRYAAVLALAVMLTSCGKLGDSNYKPSQLQKPAAKKKVDSPSTDSVTPLAADSSTITPLKELRERVLPVASDAMPPVPFVLPDIEDIFMGGSSICVRAQGRGFHFSCESGTITQNDRKQFNDYREALGKLYFCLENNSSPGIPSFDPLDNQAPEQAWMINFDRNRSSENRIMGVFHYESHPKMQIDFLNPPSDDQLDKAFDSLVSYMEALDVEPKPGGKWQNSGEKSYFLDYQIIQRQ